MATEAMLTIDAQGRISGATASDAEALAELAGGTYRAVLTSPRGRSLSQLALFQVMCGIIAANHPGGFTKDEVVQALKIECGHARPMKLGNGIYVRVAKSIAFNAMTAEAFTKFFDLALLKAAELFGADLTEAALAELERIAAPDLRDLAA